ncbi:MAG: DUF1611 domain-containing protein [Candidatus Bathyarchaeia archaeon]
MEKIPAVIMANKAFGTLEGKTANGLVMYQRKFKIVAVIDETKAGQDAGEVLGIGKLGVPIVKNIDEALKYNPKALIIGIAPPGGELPTEWRETIKKAIINKLDIWSGLHHFFNDDPEFSSLAKKYRVKLIDVRKPPPDKKVLSGEILDVKVPVIAVLSTDAASGKNMAIMEMIKEAEARGLKPGFVATGQTTIMMGGDVGAVVDALPGDFMPGTVEKMVVEVSKMGKDFILVEGQGSLSHPAYGHESLSVLYGSQPDAVILVHDPFRKTRDGFPRFKVPSPLEEISLIEKVSPKSKVVGIAINGYKRSDKEVKEAIKKIEEETKLPATDVVRFGASKLLDAVLNYLSKVGYTIGKK